MAQNQARFNSSSASQQSMPPRGTVGGNLPNLANNNATLNRPPTGGTINNATMNRPPTGGTINNANMNATMNRPATGGSRPQTGQKQAKSSEDAIRLIIEYIQKKDSSARSLRNFFFEYDLYEARVFEQWEMEFMFPQIDPSSFELIHKDNSARASLKQG